MAVVRWLGIGTLLIAQWALPSTGLAAEPRAPLPNLTVAAVGDIMLGTDYPQNRLPDGDGASMLAGVAEVLRSADVTFGNLEGALRDGGEPGKECKDPAACYLFRSPARYVEHLKAAGFTAMSLANNHARDFGEDGRTEVMRILDEAGIQHSGRQGDLASWRVGDYRVAMVAFAPIKECYSPLDIPRARLIVASLAVGHHVVIVSLHGGAEGGDVSRLPFAPEFYYGEHRGDVVAFSRAVIDAGADLVIGHGPHVPRAIEIYRERLIAYSLGNFATYYGINVAGARGYAPILLAELDERGRFVAGKIVSAIQIRTAGPRLDPRQRALAMIRQLTELDFGPESIRFEDDGRFFPPHH